MAQQFWPLTLDSVYQEWPLVLNDGTINSFGNTTSVGIGTANSVFYEVYTITATVGVGGFGNTVSEGIGSASGTSAPQAFGFGNTISSAVSSISSDNPAIIIVVAPSTESVSWGPNGVQNVSVGWQSSNLFAAYKIKLVNSIYDVHTSGIDLGVAGGSTNVSGSAGNYQPNTTITTTIDGNDIKTASAADGTKLIKIFVQSNLGVWST